MYYTPVAKLPCSICLREIIPIIDEERGNNSLNVADYDIVLRRIFGESPTDEQSTKFAEMSSIISKSAYRIRPLEGKNYFVKVCDEMNIAIAEDGTTHAIKDSVEAIQEMRDYNSASRKL